MIVHKNDDHVLLEIMCVCLLCFMFVGCALMEEGKCGCFVYPDLDVGVC